MENPPLPIADRLSVAFSLHRFGVRMMRQNFVRRNPQASEDEIDEMLTRWMRERPLDGAGQPSHRFVRD